VSRLRKRTAQFAEVPTPVRGGAGPIQGCGRFNRTQVVLDATAAAKLLMEAYASVRKPRWTWRPNSLVSSGFDAKTKAASPKDDREDL